MYHVSRMKEQGSLLLVSITN